MNCLARNQRRLLPLLAHNNGSNLQQVRWWVRQSSSRRKSRLDMDKGRDRGGGKPSVWWTVDGEMHEVGDNVPPRERFLIPRDNFPNRRRKQMREQYMRRTRLIIKESDHETWCRKYMELYNELRENWERLYWDEGFSKKIARDYANYESAEDDDVDFSPYRRDRLHAGENKNQSFGGNRHDFRGNRQDFGRSRQDSGRNMQDFGENRQDFGRTREDFGGNRQDFRRSRQDFGGNRQDFGRIMQEFGGNMQDSGENRQDDTWRKVGQIRDKFEYDREKRMRETAFAPMNMASNLNSQNPASRVQPFDTEKFFPNSASRVQPSDTEKSFPDSASRVQPFNAEKSFPDSASRVQPFDTEKSFPDSASRVQPFDAEKSFPDSASRVQPFDAEKFFPDSASRVQPSDTEKFFPDSASKVQPFDAEKFFPGSSRDD